MDKLEKDALGRSTFLKATAGAVAGSALLGAPALLRPSRADAATTRGPVRGGTLTASVAEEIKILDAHTSELATWRFVRENVWDTLIWQDLEGPTPTLKPRLALSWGYTDPTTFDLTLRPNVKFHDGSTFTAEDAKFNLDRVLNPSLNTVLGAGLGPVDKVIVVGPLHLRIKMKQPFAALALGLSHVYIYPKTATQDTFTKKPIGTGPFTFTEFRPGAYTKLTRFPQYWESGVPYLDEVMIPLIPEASSRLAALQSGQTDLLIQLNLSDVATVKGNSNLVLLVNQVRDFGDILYVNSHRKPLDNPLARQAVSYLVDRQTFYKVFLKGYGAGNCSPWIPQNFAYNPAEGDLSRFPYDLKQAASLLSKAGYPNGKGFHLTFSLVNGFPEWAQGAQMIQAAVAQLGGSMDIVPVEGPVWVDTIEKTFNYDLSFDFSGAAASDPAATLSDHFFFAPNAVISRYNNPAMATLIAQASSKLTVAQRRPLYWQWQKLWNQNLYGMIVGKRDVLSASTTHVHGYVENPDQYRNLRYTYVTR